MVPIGLMSSLALPWEHLGQCAVCLQLPIAVRHTSRQLSKSSVHPKAIHPLHPVMTMDGGMKVGGGRSTERRNGQNMIRL